MKNLVVLIIPVLLLAQPPQSEHFTLTKSVVDAGGGLSASSNFQLVSAYGQATPVCIQSSTHFIMYAGFLTPSLGVSPLSPIQELVIYPDGENARLWWEHVPGAESYSVYRDEEYAFTAGPGNFVATVADTFFEDVGVLANPLIQQYYIILVNGPSSRGESDGRGDPKLNQEALE